MIDEKEKERQIKWAIDDAEMEMELCIKELNALKLIAVYVPNEIYKEILGKIMRSWSHRIYISPKFTFTQAGQILGGKYFDLKKPSIKQMNKWAENDKET